MTPIPSLLLALLFLNLASPPLAAHRIVSSQVLRCGSPPAAAGRRHLLNSIEDDEDPVIAASQADTAPRPDRLQCRDKGSLLIEVKGDDFKEHILGISCLGSPNGQCPCQCNYLSDANCTCRDIVRPQRLNVTLTANQAEYYVRGYGTYFWNAEERVARVSACPASSSCFCCGCDRREQYDPTASFLTTRAYAACPTVSGQSTMTSHCYEVTDNAPYKSDLVLGRGAPKITADVNMLTLRVQPRGIYEPVFATMAGGTKVLTVGRDSDISAQWEGEYSHPDWRTNLLIRPARTENLTRWMMVSRDMAPAAGSSMTTCNKIGTPASVFVAQPERCQRGVSQCMRGQLAALFDQDQARLAAGQEPQYLLSRWTKTPRSIQFRPEPSKTIPDRVRMVVPLSPDPRRPLYMRVEFNLATLDFKSRWPEGQLANVTFCGTRDPECLTPQRDSPGWYIHGSLTNLGTAFGNYSVTVTCSVPWRRVPVLIYFVPAGTTAPIDIIPVAFTGDRSTPEWFQSFSTGNCTLLLQDPQGTLLQELVLPFTGGSSREGGVAAGSTVRDPCARCNTGDAACLSRNNCSKQLATIFTPVSVGVAAVIVIMLWVFWDVLFPSEEEGSGPQAGGEGGRKRRGGKKGSHRGHEENEG